MVIAASAGARRALAGAVSLAALAAASCAAPPGPPIAADEGPAAEGCSLTPNAEFTRFQTDREAVLEERDARRVSGLIVSVRPSQAGAFRAMSVWTSIDGDYAIEERSGGLYEVSFEDPADIPRVMGELEEADAIVEYVEYNAYLYPNQVEPDDPCYAVQWHYWPREGEGARVAPGGAALPARWEATTGARDVVVAVLDTGFASNSDNRADNLVSGFDFVSSLVISGDGDGRDDDPTDPGDIFGSFHGTHVAGTVGTASTNNGAEVASVNWEVSVQPVRVLGTLGGETIDIIDAIRWAAGLAVPGAPPNETPARVINLSLGGPGACPRAMQAAIDDATEAGALVVVAAGNDARDAAGFSPAGCANVLTVAAGDFNGTLARYSNFGAAVDLMAPGGDVNADANLDGLPDGVVSTVRDGLASYNGTSMAAPHVAGVAALLLAEDPTLTPAELTERLTSTAIPRTAAQCPRACGAGLLNAEPEADVVAAAGAR